jgi:hypothetical protein
VRFLTSGFCVSKNVPQAPPDYHCEGSSWHTAVNSLRFSTLKFEKIDFKSWWHSFANTSAIFRLSPNLRESRWNKNLWVKNLHRLCHMWNLQEYFDDIYLVHTVPKTRQISEKIREEVPRRENLPVIRGNEDYFLRITRKFSLQGTSSSLPTKICQIFGIVQKFIKHRNFVK